MPKNPPDGAWAKERRSPCKIYFVGLSSSLRSALHPTGPSGRAVLIFSRASNPRESKEEAVLPFYCLLSEVAFRHFAISWQSHRPGTLHVCYGGTAQGHEYQQRRGTEGQPGGCLPQTLLVTASKNIKHLRINLTKHMLNLQRCSSFSKLFWLF